MKVSKTLRDKFDVANRRYAVLAEEVRSTFGGKWKRWGGSTRHVSRNSKASL